MQLRHWTKRDLEQWKEAEARLASLRPDERDVLAERVKAELRSRSRWLTESESSPFFARALRAGMISALLREYGTSADRDVEMPPAQIS